MARVNESARYYSECDSVFKSQIFKLFHEEMRVILNRYRGLCRSVEGPSLYRNQGKWEVLEKEVLSAFDRIRDNLKTEAGSTTVSAKE